jgi:hypothetical protein
MLKDHVSLRNRAIEIARAQPREALTIAQSIDDPWYRCQALSAAARYLPEEAYLAPLQEAFDMAATLVEPNRIVMVSNWPLEVLCARRGWAQAPDEVRRLLSIIAGEPSPVRRGHALEKMVSVVPVCPLLDTIIAEFASACFTPLLNGKRNTRGESMLVRSLRKIHAHSPRLAEHLAARVQGPDLRERAVEVLRRLREDRDS